LHRSQNPDVARETLKNGIQSVQFFAPATFNAFLQCGTAIAIIFLLRSRAAIASRGHPSPLTSLRQDTACRLEIHTKQRRRHAPVKSISFSITDARFEQSANCKSDTAVSTRLGTFTLISLSSYPEIEMFP
jgi:hypothetical protein